MSKKKSTLRTVSLRTLPEKRFRRHFSDKVVQEDLCALFIFNGELYSAEGELLEHSYDTSRLNFQGRLWLEPGWKIEGKSLRIYVAEKHQMYPIFSSSTKEVWRTDMHGASEWIEQDIAYEVIGLNKNLAPQELSIDDSSGLPLGFSILELGHQLYACSFLNNRAVLRIALESPNLFLERRVHRRRAVDSSSTAVEQTLQSGFESRWIKDPTLVISEESQEFIRDGCWQSQNQAS